jgi:hypothetical protein
MSAIDIVFTVVVVTVFLAIAVGTWLVLEEYRKDKP